MDQSLPQAGPESPLLVTDQVEHSGNDRTGHPLNPTRVSAPSEIIPPTSGSMRCNASADCV